MTISMNVVGQQVAMDGRLKATSDSAVRDQVAQAATVKKAEAPVNEDQLQAGLKQLQELSNRLGTKLHFNVNRELNRVIIKVIDPATDKVIKEIPSEDMQKLQLHIKEALGVIIDEKR